MTRLWRVTLTSFDPAIVLATEHWYAKLLGPYEWTVERLLTQADADRLNALDRRRGAGDDPGFTWTAGEPTARFDSEADAMSATLAAFRHLAGPDDILTTGDRLNPGPAWPASPDEPHMADLLTAMAADAAAVNDTSVRKALNDGWAGILAALDTSPPERRPFDALDTSVVVARDGDTWTVVAACEACGEPHGPECPDADIDYSKPLITPDSEL